MSTLKSFVVKILDQQHKTTYLQEMLRAMSATASPRFGACGTGAPGTKV
jgi:hypothetical protein